jgi:hypothetical protein
MFMLSLNGELPAGFGFTGVGAAGVAGLTAATPEVVATD